MTQMSLTETRMIEGTWEAVLSAHRPDAAAPQLKVHLQDKPLDGMVMRSGSAPGQWHLQFPIPPEALSDGVQTFLVSDAESGAFLATFSLLAGDVLDHDLRAELDMLKKAFRRHCAETA